MSHFFARENYKSDEFDALGWVWVAAVWTEFEQLYRSASVLSDFVTAIEGDKTARGYALEKWIEVRGHLENLKVDLPQRLRSRLDEMCDKRDPFFFRDWTCVANLMDPRYRGESLGPDRKRRTINFILTEGWKKLMGDTPPPTTDDFFHFINLTGVYSTGRPWISPTLTPASFWSVFTDTSLSEFALKAAQLPATTASVERVWSHMAQNIHGRERMGLDNLADEVFVSWNAHLLGYPV